MNHEVQLAEMIQLPEVTLVRPGGMPYYEFACPCGVKGSTQAAGVKRCSFCGTSFRTVLPASGKRRNLFGRRKDEDL